MNQIVVIVYDVISLYVIDDVFWLQPPFIRFAGIETKVWRGEHWEDQQDYIFWTRNKAVEKGNFSE